jgi:serine/threonine-protein kinase
VVLAQTSGPRGRPQRQQEEGNWLVVVGVIVVVMAVVGGIIFVFMKSQGDKPRKTKVSESAQAIGGYRLEKTLQQGLTSQVWEAVEQVSGRHFAIKMLFPEAARDPVQRQLFCNEADVGIELAHPNVIKIIKVFKEAKSPCFVMEFFPSGSVRQRIQYRDWDYIKENAHNILKQTATALAYMNSNGWLHRDVKPDNILVNSAGDVRIIDFAIAQRIPTGLAKWFRKKDRSGTRSYMSPEAVRCEALDTRSDIYSFGATCYEIVTFRTPFKGATANDLLNKQLFEKPPSPQTYCPDLSDDFSKLILRMLAKKREERPQNFHEVLMELRKIKLFKTANPAPPSGGASLYLHPETASMRRAASMGSTPKPPPDSQGKPKS